MADLTPRGRLFHNLGARRAKARSPQVLNFEHGTIRSPCPDDLAGLRDLYEVSDSLIYGGAKLCKALKAIRRIM